MFVSDCVTGAMLTSAESSLVIVPVPVSLVMVTLLVSDCTFSSLIVNCSVNSILLSPLIVISIVCVSLAVPAKLNVPVFEA